MRSWSMAAVLGLTSAALLSACGGGGNQSQIDSNAGDAPQTFDSLLVFDLHGISPTPITNFVAGHRQLTAGLAFTYLGNVSGDIAYMRYIGAGQQNLLRDRDNVQAVIKYSF